MSEIYLTIDNDSYKIHPSELYYSLSSGEYPNVELRGQIEQPVVMSNLKALNPIRILQSGNRVIVFWSDDTKTIVKRSEDTEDDIYGAFTAALAIKVYGTNSQVHRIIDRKHERIDKINGKQYVVSNYEERKAVRKWMKERGHGKKVD